MISTRLAGVLLQKTQCPSLVLRAISAARLVDIGPLVLTNLLCPHLSLFQENSNGDVVQNWSSAKGSDAGRGGSLSHHCNSLPLCLSQSLTSRAQHFVSLPARIGLSAPSRSFSSAGSRAFAESAHEPSKAQPVSWRDFEDIGVWSIDEEPAAGVRTRGEPQTSSSPPFASGGFVDNRAESDPGERKSDLVTNLQLRTSNGGFLREESGKGGKELDSSSSGSKASGARLGGDSQESGDQSVTWRDFEDLGSWVVDEAERNEAEENPIKRSDSKQNRAKASSDSVTAALQSKTPPAKSKKKSKQREMIYVEGSLIEVPKPKGPPLTDEELALSFFDLCQLPSLRGVEDVDDFLKLSDEDLLRQCEVGTARGSGKGGQKRNKTESKVQLRHIPTGLTAASDKTRSQHANKKKALEALQEKIALKVRRRIPDGPYNPPRRVRAMIPPADLHPDWAFRTQVRFGRNHPDFVKGAQVLLDLVVSCNGDFAKAADKVRMEEARFRRLLRQNLHVQHHMKIIKNFRKQRIVHEYEASLSASRDTPQTR